MNLVPPEYEKVVADCDEALKLDKTYIKVVAGVVSIDFH